MSSEGNTFQHLVLGATMGTALGGLLGYIGGKQGPGPKYGAALGALLGGGVAYGTLRSAPQSAGLEDERESLRRTREVYEDALHRARLATERAEAAARRPFAHPTPEVVAQEREPEMTYSAPRRVRAPQQMPRQAPRELPRYDGFYEGDAQERELVYDERTDMYAAR